MKYIVSSKNGKARGLSEIEGTTEDIPLPEPVGIHSPTEKERQ